jgi:hypothetical protein
MPWFYVDDAFADSKPVMRLDARLRNEAVGLWVRCGAWSAKEETDGHIPIDVVRGFGGNKRLIEALAHQAELWHPVEYDRKWGKTREILFQNWEKWQKTHAENEAKRKSDAERQAKHRRVKKGRNYVPDSSLSSADAITSQRDTDTADNRDSKFVSRCESQRPDPDPTLIPTYVGTESSLNVGGDERGLSAPVNVSASRLVATLIPDTFPAAVRTALRLKASELMTRDQIPADDVADALRRWLAKPDAGPGLLPNLVADVQRARTAPAANGKPHKLRVVAELAAQARAAENAQLANQPRKEINP